MAMGSESRREAIRAFSNHSQFANSTSSLTAAPGATRDIGWLVGQPHAASLRDSARAASYTVYSYKTPIGWAVEDEETGLFERVIPAVSHSNTTGNHQNILRDAWEGSYHDGTDKGRAAWLADHRAAV